MDTMLAFAMGQANRGREAKVFDWDKAARLIVEKKPGSAYAGLIEDWGYTGGCIFRAGEPVPEEDTYVYLSSTWATPVLMLDGDEVECWVMESETEYGSGTYWPESALEILKGAKDE